MHLHIRSKQRAYNGLLTNQNSTKGMSFPANTSKHHISVEFPHENSVSIWLHNGHTAQMKMLF